MDKRIQTRFYLGRETGRGRLAKGKVAGILAIMFVGLVAGYFFYHDYVQGTVTLSITDPPQTQNGNRQHYNSSILHIFLSFSEIDLHQGGFGSQNSTGWIPIVVSPTTVDMISVLTGSRTLASRNLSTGLYDQLRFPVSSAIVTFQKLGNVTYTVPSGSLKVSITGGGFQSSPGSRVNLLLTISFNDAEILSMNGNLTPHATAQIVG